MANILDQYAYGTTWVYGPLRYASNTNVLFAQSFTPTQTSVSQVILKLQKSGSPTGNVWVEIYTDTGSNAPNIQTGADSSTIACADISGPANYTFTFSTPVTVTASTKYWLVVNGDYAFSTTVYIGIGRDNTTDTYPGHEIQSYNSATWEAYSSGNDEWFEEYYYVSDTTTTSTSTSTSSSSTSTSTSSTTTRTTLTSSSTSSSSTSTSTSTSSSSSTSTSTSSTTTIVPYYIGDPIPEIIIMEEI